MSIVSDTVHGLDAVQKNVQASAGIPEAGRFWMPSSLPRKVDENGGAYMKGASL